MTTLLPSANFFINTTRDILFVILFVKTIDANRKGTAWRKPLALGLLVALSFLRTLLDHYFYEVHFDLMPPEQAHATISYIRNLLYYVSYFLYILVLKKLPLRVVIYDALLVSAICLACHNIFLTPVTKPIIDCTVMWSENPTFNRLLCLLVVNVISILIYFLIYKMISLKHIYYVDRFRMALLLSLVLVSVYFNGTVKSMEFIDVDYAMKLSGYLIILQFLILMCIVYFEHSKHLSETQSRVMLENQAVHSLLKNIQKQEQNDARIRRMHHDLKNHMISLRYLLINQELDDALSYIDSLSNEDTVDNTKVRTGNLVIDGILMQKMEIAQEQNINVSVAADFSFLEPMDKTDVCVIFGNLLDNALEGCQKVSEETRFINIRGRKLDETVIYSIENSFNGDVEFIKGIPVTTKTERHLHGIGLQSVQNIVDKYSGTIVFSNKENLFQVVCAFPVPFS